MNKTLQCFLLAAALGFAMGAKANQSFEKILDQQIKRHKVKKENLSVLVSSSEGGNSQVLVSLNPKKKMIPASITKLLTTAAVMEEFLPGTRFKTQIYLSSEPTESLHKGPIYLKGGGDPSFVSENMWFLVNTFKRTNISVIEGDIIVDDTLFDKVRYDESREDIRVDRAYDAPVGAMSFNWNSVNIYVRPGKIGQKASVFLDPENEYSQLENKTKTINGSKAKVSVRRKKVKNKDVFVVSGEVGLQAKEVVIFKNITQPDLWSGYQLKSFLAQRGIQVKGEVKTGKVPASAYLAAESESKPVEHIVADMNKFSNNYVAEMLCKHLGLQKRQPASISDGMESIKNYLKKLGVQDEEYDLYNPSGLTRDNKFTAEVMWKVLKHLREDFRVQPEILSSLPIAGIDGTLKRRMVNSPAERWVRGKTGLLTGVVALAGYAGRKDGTPLTYVFIYNGPQNGADVRKFYDDLLIEFVK